jgi:hypothetical protein
MYVLSNLGQGAFSETPQLIRTVDVVRSLAIDDVNGDGRPDLILGHSLSIFSILLGTGQGRFASHIRQDIPAAAIRLQSADLDGDGRRELVSLSQDGMLSLWRGDGRGHFVQAGHFPVGTLPTDLLITELNGDLRPDLVISGRSESLFVLTNQGGLRFVTQQHSLLASPTKVLASDFDGDTRTDLLVLTQGDIISLFSSDGRGGLRRPRLFLATEKMTTGDVVDLDGDRRPDLLVAGYGGADVIAIRNQGKGLFPLPLLMQLQQKPQALATADLNGDGKAELLSLSEDGQTVEIWSWDGTAEPIFRSRLNTMVQHAKNVRLLLSDLNGDKRQDLMLLGGDEALLQIFLHSTVETEPFLFSAPKTIPMQLGSGPMTMASTDINQDGKSDVLIGSTQENIITILLGDGLGGFFSPPIKMLAGGSPVQLAAGPINDSRRTDVAVVDGAGKRISILLSQLEK